jgi:hypothetical protein
MVQRKIGRTYFFYEFIIGLEFSASLLGLLQACKTDGAAIKSYVHTILQVKNTLLN